MDNVEKAPSNPFLDKVTMAKSLFGILPPDITLEDARAERLDLLQETKTEE